MSGDREVNPPSRDWERVVFLTTALKPGRKEMFRQVQERASGGGDNIGRFHHELKGSQRLLPERWPLLLLRHAIRSTCDIQ